VQNESRDDANGAKKVSEREFLPAFPLPVANSGGNGTTGSGMWLRESLQVFPDFVADPAERRETLILGTLQWGVVSDSLR
jgi:hypothetical protein